MHPRTELKNELKTAIAGFLGDVPVYAARSRELRSSDAEAVIIYTPSESLARTPGRGEARHRAPVARSISVDILVVVARPGDGEASADRADEIARQISLHLSDVAPALAPVSEEQSFSTGEDARVVTTLSYQLEITDRMEA